MVYKAYKYLTNPDRGVGIMDGSVITLGSTTTPPPAGFSLVLDEQFADLSRWNVHDNDHNNGTAAPQSRIQSYMAANSLSGTGASAGATGGTSLRQVVRRDNPTSTHEFSAGMLDSQNAGRLYPLYGRIEFRCKIPHGQGLWPSTWLTVSGAKGGANIAEWDMMEYFHGQLPGKNSSTFHGTMGDNTFKSNWFTNNQSRTFFEAPTYTPAWHTWMSEIMPVTDSTGNTIGDLTKPSQNIRFKMFLDGVEVYRFVNPDSLNWSTKGMNPDVNSFWNIYIQGTQVSGSYVGHPDVELAYSDVRNACLIGGTPGSCTKSTGGYNVIRAGAPGATATMGGVAVTTEHDYIKVYKAV